MTGSVLHLIDRVTRASILPKVLSLSSLGGWPPECKGHEIYCVENPVFYRQVSLIALLPVVVGHMISVFRLTKPHKNNIKPDRHNTLLLSMGLALNMLPELLFDVHAKFPDKTKAYPHILCIRFAFCRGLVSWFLHWCWGITRYWPVKRPRITRVNGSNGAYKGG